MSGDSRKDFILKTIGNSFPSASRQLKEFFTSVALNNFLDNGSCIFLSVIENAEQDIKLSNEVAFQENESSTNYSKNLLLFYKRAPNIITPDNLYKDVLVSSMLGSPIQSLYHSLHQIYAPLLLKDTEWSVKCTQTLQKLICDLEIGLGSFITGQPKSDKEKENNLSAILSVEDELQYWSVTSNTSKRDKAFALVLQGLVDGLQSLESVPLSDAEDIMDVAHNALDDLWRVDHVQVYPQDRMAHLMQLCEIELSAYMQSKLKDIEVWTGNFIFVEEALNSCVDLCNKWCEICLQLTSTFWSQNSAHKWQGSAYTARYVSGLSLRLQKLLELRSLHHQLTRLLSNEEQNEVMKGGDVFAPFSKINAVQFNPYTEPIWQLAVQQFVNNLQPAEKRVASKLRTLLHHSSMIPLQLLQDYKRYSALIKLPYIKKEITAERTLLLGQLILYVKSSQKEFNEMSISGNLAASQKCATLSEVVHRLIWAGQFKAKCDDIIVTSQNLLDDLPDFGKFMKFTKDFLDEIKSFQSELFGDWCREIQDSIKSNQLSLATDKPVMSFNKDRQMIVTFNPRLVSLIREVRQLSLLGFNVPQKIQETAEQANKYSKQAKELQQISNFHNTIGYQMIPSQRPMMLEAAIHLEKLVSNQTEMTWNDPAVLQRYIKQLQESVERLSRENRKLRNYHTSVCDKVKVLMDTDLLKQHQQWKEGLLQIRSIISTVEQQGYSAENMTTWKLHWDMELYKALEYQYLRGLEVLHENLPEIHVELTYRQQTLQFRPPLEEIKSKYYGQMKRFLNIPCVFKGVNEFAIAEKSVFTEIMDRNADRFTKLYDNANSIFQRLEELRDSFKHWILFGTTNMEAFCEENIKSVEDWDRSFRSIKAKSQEAGKIPNDQKVDCILVNFSPIKAVIDDQIQSLWDTLKSLLRNSILNDYNHVNGYVKTAMECLSTRPQTVEEIGVSNCKWKEYSSNKGDVYKIFEKAKAKNKLMGLWVKDKVELLSDLKTYWDSFEQRMEIHNLVIQKQVEDIKANMGLQLGNFLQDIEKFAARWNEMKPKSDLFEYDKNKVLEGIAIIKEKKKEFELLMQAQRKLISDYEQFGMEVPKFEESEMIGKDIEQVSHVWFLFEEFNNGLLKLSSEEWILVRNKTYILEEFLAGWDEKLQSTEVKMGPLSVWLLQEVTQYKALLPILKYCRGDHFSSEHWAQIFQMIGIPSNTSVENLTFGNFLEAKEALINSTELLKELNNRAQGEISIRQALGELDAWGMTARFTLIEYKDNSESQTVIIKEWKDLLNKVSDNQNLLQSLQDSPYYKLFADRASLWEKRLVDLDSHLHNLHEIQRKWVYLEPIFGRGALVKEQMRFKRINDDFRNIMSDISRNNLVVSLCSFADLKQILETLKDQLQRCQKSLNEFLEEKRSAFPRFYFIADDDLLEILGQSTNPNVIQAHLKKLFSGIHTVVFDEALGCIVSMKSAAGEIVALSEKVPISQDVEGWLKRLGDEMKSTLKQLLVQCVADGRSNAIDPNRYPQQVLCLAQQILFTERCEEAIQNATLSSYLSDLKSLLHSYTNASALNDDISIVSKLKLKALILDTIQAISVVEQLLRARTFSLDDWQWLKQLRFYMKGDLAVVKMVDAQFEYTYEYQGNVAKLVHTPLTDKCFLTLTQGVRVGLGGNPFGPAGTGKTESVKSLGSQMGRQVIVFNCDEGIDVKSMGRIFIGIVKCGAWGCFDEFNRLEERVLSAVSTQIQSIQASLKNHLPTAQLLGKSIPIDPNCGLFITLNPMGKGYGGRQKLPDNLKQLFRPIMMSVPDNDLIAEVLLFADGYKNAKSLGRKLVTVFNLSKELLTPQQHYDWGLRALKTVLKGCGKCLQQARLNLTDEEKMTNLDESELVVQALRVNTLSKLTFSDCRRFNSLVTDIFPNTRITDIAGGILNEAIKASFQDLGLTLLETQIQKVIELHEQLEQRMGVVIVGPSQVGKSTIWKILLNALGRISDSPKYLTVNPKSMPKSLVLGQIDTDTREWTDGVLTNAVRQAVKESHATWIICDGDIDPEWIESLNSVLDDNHLLTMPSGERIQIDSNVNFIFETHSLNCASPATVSRVGVIHISNDDDAFLKALVSSWIQCQPDGCKDTLKSLIDEYFYRAVHWVKNQTEFVLETSMEGIAQCALRQLEGVSDRSQFVVNLVKGLGCTLIDSAREALAKELFSWSGEICPDAQNPLNCFFDVKRHRLEVFQQQAAAEWTIEMLRDDLLPLMRTAEVQRYMHHILPWLQSDTCVPFLLVGPEGCGKSLLLHHCFQMLKSAQVVSIQCSAQTGTDQVLRKLHQVCVSMSTNCGRVFRPKDSSLLILYLKDLNLPKADAWGTCQLIAFLQQVVTYNGFYDFNLEWVGLEKVQIVGSLTNSGSLGRQTLSARFTSIVNVCPISYPEKQNLEAICECYLQPICAEALRNQAVNCNQLSRVMIALYNNVRNKFTTDDHSHYVFTPRDLIRWILALNRYDLRSLILVNLGSFLEAFAYEGMRTFSDRLVSKESQRYVHSVMASLLESEVGHGTWPMSLEDVFYVSWGAGSKSSGAPVPPFGRALGKLAPDDLQKVVRKGIVQFSREHRELNLVVVREVLCLISQLDRILGLPGGSIVLIGPSGVGKRSLVSVVANMHALKLFTLTLFPGYGIKNFRNELKSVMQVAGVEGEQVLLLIEDYQLVDPSFLEIIGGLVASGEVPGLYTPEELESLIGPLRDLAAQDGFRGSHVAYFASLVRKNLHVALLMESHSPDLGFNLERFPALYKACRVVWLHEWSSESMRHVAEFCLEKELDEDAEAARKLSPMFVNVHENMGKVDHEELPKGAISSPAPRKYLAFLATYCQLLRAKKDVIVKRKSRLEVGVGKLDEAKAVVETLKDEAAKRSVLLEEKRAEADKALNLITNSMQNASDQKTEMETLKDETLKENEKLAKRKKAIDAELSEIEPLINEAKAAVGNIKTESLSEIRSLRAPPDTIRDILEAVLRLMGIFDTSWNNMKSFLAKRGIKEEICSFDARKISPDIRESVEELLKTRRDSFDPKNAKRASVAAAPLAAWVQANVRYAKVLEKILPLEQEQSKLKKNLTKAESRIGRLSSDLDNVDKYVSDLRDQLNRSTKEAAEIEIGLQKSNETIKAAEALVTGLESEHRRWSLQVKELEREIVELPSQALVAAACITYLADTNEDTRSKVLQHIAALGKSENSFDLLKFLSSEKEQLQWRKEGLPSDRSSSENALIILQSTLSPFLIDPSSKATEWLKIHLHDKKIESVNQKDTNFMTVLEHAVRFGKILIIQEVEGVEPVLFPLLRKDLISMGPRYVVRIGEKVVDFNENFKLLLTTRDANVEIPTFAQSVITVINFSTTRTGLFRQLIEKALMYEKPDLENKRSELLRQEEELKLRLNHLEDSLLEQLVNAQGNILDNRELLSSLNKTKGSSVTAAKSLEESLQLQENLEKERDVYQPLAEFGSTLYFVLADMVKMSNMYSFSLDSFLKIFNKALQIDHAEAESHTRIKKLMVRLQNLVYEYVASSTFKCDQLMLALHLVHGMYPRFFETNEWEAFTGVLVTDLKADQIGSRNTMPSWINTDRSLAFVILKTVFPGLYQKLKIDDATLWSNFATSMHCEKEIPAPVSESVSNFQKVLIVQALRPDRLASAMTRFACKSLGLRELSPIALNLKTLLKETNAKEPILVIVSPGTDPTQELFEIARSVIGESRYHQMAMGQGQAEVAIDLLHQCSSSGDWLCLNNLHLVTGWLPILEKELKNLTPQEGFRLWLTTEPHEAFPTVLLQSCRKVAYEAPPGIKRNLQRTFESWSPDFFSGSGILTRSRALFSLAWFHAIIQERRRFIPQGWTKFYEFSYADLQAASDIVDRFCSHQGSSKQTNRWESVRGLFENAVYGGRIDSSFDIRVLSSYLEGFFNSKLETGIPLGNSSFLKDVRLPNSTNYKDFKDIVDKLSDIDDPTCFGLPANVERAVQKFSSSFAITHLRILMRSDDIARKFERDKWHTELSPILNLWKKLNQGSQMVKMQLSNLNPQYEDEKPVHSFVQLEFYNCVKLVQLIHHTLAALSRVIRGSKLLTNDVHILATSLLRQETPDVWQNEWDGPLEPVPYLRIIMFKSMSVGHWVEKCRKSTLFNDAINLSELFHASTFLHALQHQTAREVKGELDNLKLVASWKGAIGGCKLNIQLTGLEIEGCIFNGNQLSENLHSSAIVNYVPPGTIGWIPKASNASSNIDDVIPLPVYSSSGRENLVTILEVPCAAGEQRKWIQAGVALFIQSPKLV